MSIRTNIYVTSFLDRKIFLKVSDSRIWPIRLSSTGHPPIAKISSPIGECPLYFCQLMEEFNEVLLVLIKEDWKRFHAKTQDVLYISGAAERFKIRWGSSLSSLHVPSFTALIQVRLSLILPNLDEAQVFQAYSLRRL